MNYGRMHRLNQVSRHKPAKLFDYRAPTLNIKVKQFGRFILSFRPFGMNAIDGRKRVPRYRSDGGRI
jgi:hypothetical protein